MFIFNKFGLIVLFIFAAISNVVNAKDVHIGPIMLDNVTITNVASFGHKAGNLEIKVTNGIADLKGLNCDPNHLTTSNDGVGFQDMVAVLLTAHAASKPLNIGVTDNPTYTAYPGRCSLVYASVIKQ
ncbi:hypothetical protein [Grimontia sp. NTOU-MAR1]|uniref:hypothetical protein n=1 Tax=Grimontia sp. NTOU-MAR1 TaxID=3111011 RepID=UPI002DB7F380|nr:hypothetical protein [Grimontia sp. NTOU-MAR1]WRV97721.1 hypothetical protein VP504_17065 [Grimontia sp. NTOU-MAR1]